MSSPFDGASPERWAKLTAFIDEHYVVVPTGPEFPVTLRSCKTCGAVVAGGSEVTHVAWYGHGREEQP